jgi:transcriptional regulator with XRE-family HTH domain
VDIAISRCRTTNSVRGMETIHAQTHIETLQTRMRLIRESRHLTLVQAAQLSKGQISAIALGSYERGDRSVSANKLFVIAQIYEVPISELFEVQPNFMPEERISIDVRKILTTNDPVAKAITEVVRNIARMRGDWNGEVISLRGQDINNFQLFTGLTTEAVKRIIEEYKFPRSK